MPDSPDRRSNPKPDPDATPEGPANGAAWSEANIQILSLQQAIRKRPSVFCLDTGFDGLHALLYELVGNSIQEALAGHGETIEVTLHADGSASVADDGRGIPVGTHPQFDGLDRLELALTKSHN